MEQVTVEQLAQKAYGSNESARIVLAKAREYSNIALTNGYNWYGAALPGATTREDLQRAIDSLTLQLSQQGLYPEAQSPFWEQARKLLWQARAEAAAVDEGKAAAVSNILVLPSDLMESAREVAGDIGGVAGEIVGGAGNIIGSAAGGILGGLGITGVLVGIAAIAAGYLYIKGRV